MARSTRRWGGWSAWAPAVVIGLHAGSLATAQDFGPWPDSAGAVEAAVSEDNGKVETAGGDQGSVGSGGSRAAPGAVESRATESLPLGVASQGEADGTQRGASGVGWGAGSSGAAIGMLAVVLALAMGSALLVRWLAKLRGGLASELGAGGRAPSGVLEVLGRYPVGRGQSLVLLRLDKRVLLLSQSVGGRRSSGGFETLCEVDDPEQVASLLMQTRDAEGESLSERFNSALRRHSDAHGGRDDWEQSIPVVDLTRSGDDAGGKLGHWLARLATSLGKGNGSPGRLGAGVTR